MSTLSTTLHRASTDRTASLDRTTTEDDEELYDIQEAFHFFDKVGDAKIGVDQVGTCLRALALCPTEAQVAQLTKLFEKDARISIEQFTPMYRDLKKADTRDRSFTELTTQLSNFDREGTGQIELALLANVLTTLGEPLSEAECADLFAKVELSANGMLNIDDLARLISEEPPLSK